MTYCGTLGQWNFVRFSDLILRKMTEGSLRTDQRASDMASTPETPAVSVERKTAFHLGPYSPPISDTKIAHWLDCELASPNGADS